MRTNYVIILKIISFRSSSTVRDVKHESEIIVIIYETILVVTTIKPSWGVCSFDTRLWVNVWSEPYLKSVVNLLGESSLHLNRLS